MTVTQGQRMTFLIGVLGLYQVTAFGGPPTSALSIPGFDAVREPGVRIVATPSRAMVPIGQTVEFRIKVEKDGEPLESGELVVRTMPPDTAPVSTEAKTLAGGVTMHRYAAPPDAPMGIHRLVITHPASGAVVDSKVSSVSGYTRHCVDPDTFEEEYRLAIRKVQNETGAKVIAISATSSVFEICRANADKRRAAGTPHNLFGKPEELEKFNAIAKRIAAELGAGYVDVYEPTRTHPDKQSLFNAVDGVHLTNAGNRFVAYELLEYFGQK